MGLPTKQFSLCFTVSMITILVGQLPASGAADYTNLVFKGCANQKFQDPSAIYTRNLKELFDALLAQSSQKSFYKRTSGDGQTAITGLYQCRGDLTTSQCATCVGKIPETVEKLCGKVIAARVHFSGCYLKYELVAFKQVSETELLYKVCGSNQASEAGFEEKRDSALNAILSGIQNGNGSFYTGENQSVFVLGQCEGDLSSGACGSCVKSAVESVKIQCGDSISGQVYLNQCYITYSYYPSGVPVISSTSGTRQHTQRTAAIAVGGVAAFGFLVVCLLFVKSLVKKRRGKSEGWN
uniref:Gnk2-homologous domain-containing protein n=1 Tax=Rhizophora mucronata TaxID=61149 RepID=A0A2P2NYW1_RHIMU